MPKHQTKFDNTSSTWSVDGISVVAQTPLPGFDHRGRVELKWKSWSLEMDCETYHALHLTTGEAANLAHRILLAIGQPNQET